MSRPRILLVTHFYATHRGGVEIGAGKIANLLAQKGYLLTWAASNTDLLPVTGVAMQYLPMEANNAIESKLGIPFPFWSRKALTLLKAAVKDADLVHIHESLYQGNGVAARTAKRFGIPYLVTQHIGFIPYKNPVLRLVLTIANKVIAMPILKKATGICYVSETTQHYFEGLGLAPKVGELIPMGVDTEVFSPEGPADRASMGFSEDQPLCVFVGRFVEKKGLPTIRLLAEANPSVQWALVGHGPIDPNEWNLPNVKVFGGLSGATLAPVYRAADLFVMPSVGEGYPAVVQESMACGTPVLISTETAEGYSPARPYLHSVPAADINEWTKTTMKLLSDTVALRATAPTLVSFARKHWSLETCLARYEDLITKAIGTTV